MRRTALIYTVLASLIMLPCLVLADVSVSIVLDRTEATLLDTIGMTVKVSGTQSSDQPILSGFKDFEIRQGGTSSRVEMINGKVSSSKEFSYTLMPEKAGTFVVGPVKVKVNGKTATSSTKTITITEPSKSKGLDRGILFLEATVSSNEIYVEEQAIYTLKLYRRESISNISLSLPEADNITFKQLGNHFEYQSVYNGQNFNVLEIRYALIPSQKGVYGIRPARMTFTLINGNSRSPFGFFDDPFFSRKTGQQKTLASEPIELTVLPLPEQGRPPDFSGLVGTFVIEGVIEQTEEKKGDSATLTVVLKGRGNIERIPDLKFPEMTDVKIYADQPVLSEAYDSKGLTGSKIMKWAIVPEKDGLCLVPSLSLSYFDTTDRTYRTTGTGDISLFVIPGEAEKIELFTVGTTNQTQPGIVKKEVQELGYDILPVHTSMKNLTGSGFHTMRPLLWIILAVPILIYGVAIYGVRFSNRSEQEICVAKAKRAAKALIKQCSQEKACASRMLTCLKDYYNDRFRLSLGALTATEAAEILLENGVSSETIKQLKQLVQNFENAAYTGRGDDVISTETLLALIKKIEKEAR